MCGIWAYIEFLRSKSITSFNDINKLYLDFMKTRHRGPDLSSFQTIKNVTVGFHRLAIMDPTFHANQPYIIEDGERTIVFICNGEIYNFKELIHNHSLHITNNSDCMTIPKLYIKFAKYNPNGPTSIKDFSNLFISDIKGEFAFLLFEFDRLQNLKQIVAGRDQIGIRPLYMSDFNKDSNTLLFSSEIKGMNTINESVLEFEPGTIMCIDINSFGRIDPGVIVYNFKTVYNTVVNKVSFGEDYYLDNIRNAVINSIKRRLVADRPIAFLLSGGVDSSLVASVSAKLLNQPINTFCCGMNEGTDLLYARKVAEHIGSNHKEVYFTPEEGLQAIRDVIYTTETWDTTTIRASVGQYLVCKHIGEKTDAKVVLVGEGPDEVCSSYLFNYYAPSGEALHNTALEYVKKIHMYDGRRADRCISRWSLEGRIPLLDPEFIEAYWTIPSELRHPKYKGIEKWWLRKAFDNTGVLCDEVLWRKKEAFSDGVSTKEKSWFQIIQDYIDTQVTDEEFNNSKWNCPTKESYYYKKLFVEFFGEKRLDIIPHYWQPKWSNDGKEVINYIDPSARVLKVYNN